MLHLLGMGLFNQLTDWDRGWNKHGTWTKRTGSA